MKKLIRYFLRFLPDSCYIRLRFYQRFGKWPNLKNPQTFSEKLQWLKLHDRNPLYTTLVDKYAVKKWVADKIGEEYIIPTLGVWNSFDEIDFNTLPNQFVLKTTHDSGGVVICRDKSKFDKDAARKKLTKSLKHNFYDRGKEWHYKNVKPRIIAESFLSDGVHSDLADYKFLCFNGNPAYCQVITERSIDEKVDFFDMEWKYQEFTGLMKAFPHATKEPNKPFCFEQMKEFCHQLAINIPFVRVDFYEINGKLSFGEMTFFPASGFGKFTPNKWNKKIGDLIQLPKD